MTMICNEDTEHAEDSGSKVTSLLTMNELGFMSATLLHDMSRSSHALSQHGHW